MSSAGEAECGDGDGDGGGGGAFTVAVICAKRLGAILAQVALSGVMPDVNVDKVGNKDVDSDGSEAIAAEFALAILTFVLSFSEGSTSVDAAAVVCFEPREVSLRGDIDDTLVEDGFRPRRREEV